jgi:hypothetical protein
MTLDDSLQITNGSGAESSVTDLAYDIGCKDVGLPESERYQPEGHTEEFMSGYHEGYYGCGGDVAPNNRGFATWEESSPNTEDDSEGAPQEDFDGKEGNTQLPSSFQQEGIDWVKMCNDLQTALVSSCEVLVNPDNTLTFEGERAVGCIRNGIALAGGGSILLSLPLPLVITALQILEEAIFTPRDSANSLRLWFMC